MHKLTQKSNCKWDIRSSDSQIDKLAYQASVPVRFLQQHSDVLSQKGEFCFIGVLSDLHPRSPVSCSKSRAYFLWDRIILSLLYVNSIPRKYFWLVHIFGDKKYRQIFLRLCNPCITTCQEDIIYIYCQEYLANCTWLDENWMINNILSKTIA